MYETRSFSDLKEKTISLSNDIKNYAFNRWLNFWSAKGVEQIFTSQENVIANENKYDKLVDFKINNIPANSNCSIVLNAPAFCFRFFKFLLKIL